LWDILVEKKFKFKSGKILASVQMILVSRYAGMEILNILYKFEISEKFYKQTVALIFRPGSPVDA
jgi:hypothetical protein